MKYDKNLGVHNGISPLNGILQKQLFNNQSTHVKVLV